MPSRLRGSPGYGYIITPLHSGKCISFFGEYSRSGDNCHVPAWPPGYLRCMFGARLFGIISVGLAIACGPSPASAQDSAVDQVQAIVIGLRSPQHALQADRHLNAIPGVLLTRTDQHTQNLFLLVNADSPDVEAAIRSALAPLGLKLSCWTRGPRRDRPFVHLDPEQCDETSPLK